MNKVISILPFQFFKMRQKLLEIPYKCREIGYLDIDQLIAKFDADMEKELQSNKSIKPTLESRVNSEGSKHGSLV